MAPDPRLVELAVHLFDAAREGDVERLRDALDAGVPVDLVDAEGNSYLMLAAYHGHLGAVELLIARGADVDRLNGAGQSPLAGVVFKQQHAVADLLMAAGADPNLGRPSAVEIDLTYGGGARFGQG
ncbi:MAG: ankyrin repeat domain-containing protein [Jiangellaceae bacterium]